MEYFKNTAVLLVLEVCFFAMIPADSNDERSQLYVLVGTSKDMMTSAVLSVYQTRSTSHCAMTCTSSTSCKSFSVKPGLPRGKECRLSMNGDPPLINQVNSTVYKITTPNIIVSTNLTTTTTATPATTTATPAATTDVVTIPSAPAPCANPAITNQPYNCGSTPTFSSTGIIKLGSNRALVFMTNNKYLKCSSMNGIVEQGAQHCEGPYNIVGDSGLDPSSTIFTSGPPTAGVGFIQSNMVDCRYYLFKGDTVYCYQHTDNNSYKPWMKPCTTGWTSMTIESRFGAGIPSDPDDVIGNLGYTYDFYFLKGNQVYKSTGDSTSGALVAGFPKLLHDVFPNMICDITAATEGMNSGEYYSVVGNKVYKEQGGTVYDKDKLCHTL